MAPDVPLPFAAVASPTITSPRLTIHGGAEIRFEHRDGATPVVVARALGSPEEAVEVTTLADLDCSRIDMP